MILFKEIRILSLFLGIQRGFSLCFVSDGQFVRTLLAFLPFILLFVPLDFSSSRSISAILFLVLSSMAVSTVLLVLPLKALLLASNASMSFTALSSCAASATSCIDLCVTNPSNHTF